MDSCALCYGVDPPLVEWWSRGGGGVCALALANRARIRCAPAALYGCAANGNSYRRITDWQELQKTDRAHEDPAACCGGPGPWLGQGGRAHEPLHAWKDGSTQGHDRFHVLEAAFQSRRPVGSASRGLPASHNSKRRFASRSYNPPLILMYYWLFLQAIQSSASAALDRTSCSSAAAGQFVLPLHTTPPIEHSSVI